ncbi:hypothetical protein COL940_013082 [Colletotrichum noveboracense]|nr:hypothetical protein COL940_013082 [Colletotrichum noveboracense]KAJ0273252.1 hypothetical protein CBS470a_012339 [Colletotrichum nupharicola]
MAIEITAAAKKKTGIDLSMFTIIEYPAIGDLCKALGGAIGATETIYSAPSSHTSTSPPSLSEEVISDEKNGCSEHILELNGRVCTDATHPGDLQDRGILSPGAHDTPQAPNLGREKTSFVWGEKGMDRWRQGKPEVKREMVSMLNYFPQKHILDLWRVQL